MNITRAVEILDEHNKWRRGRNEYEFITISDLTFSTKELGIAIDVVLEHFKCEIKV